MLLPEDVILPSSRLLAVLLAPSIECPDGCDNGLLLVAIAIVGVLLLAACVLSLLTDTSLICGCIAGGAVLPPVLDSEVETPDSDPESELDSG